MPVKKSRLHIQQKIEVSKDEESGFYKSSIQELDEDTISVAVPIRQGRRLPLRQGDTVRVQFTVDDAIYSFQATVLEQKKSNDVHLYVLTRPGLYSRIQRRNFVRFPVSLPVTFRVLSGDGEEEGEEFKGITVDISGGGLQLTASFSPEQGDMVQVRLSLDDSSPRELLLRGEVAWSYPDHWLRLTRFGIRFTEIDEMERERIISYIFRQMRQRTKVD